METFEIAGLLVMLSVPAYFALQIWTLRRWSGGWKIVAFLPLIVMVPVALYTIAAFAAQSNLWPVVIILASPLACLYFLLAAAIKTLRG